VNLTAHVYQAGWSLDSVSVTIAWRHGDSGPSTVLHFKTADDGETLVRQQHDVEPCLEVQPTFTLTDGEARALLEALIRHYHGAEDTRALRRDYDGERARVNQLIGHLAAIGRQLAAPPTAAPTQVGLIERPDFR
jgi:hypothetical protein